MDTEISSVHFFLAVSGQWVDRSALTSSLGRTRTGPGLADPASLCPTSARRLSPPSPPRPAPRLEAGGHLRGRSALLSPPAVTPPVLFLCLNERCFRFLKWGEAPRPLQCDWVVCVITRLQSHLRCDPQERKDEIASVETVNNGKSIFEARWDVDTSWQCLEYYAGLAASMAGKASPGLPRPAGREAEGRA